MIISTISSSRSDHNAAPRIAARQPGVFASGAQQFFGRPRLRLDDEVVDAAPFAANGPADEDHYWLEHDPEKACPALDAGGCRFSEEIMLK